LLNRVNVALDWGQGSESRTGWTLAVEWCCWFICSHQLVTTEVLKAVAEGFSVPKM